MAHTDRGSTLGDQFYHLETELITQARQRMQSINWNEMRQFNLQGITSYCGRQPLAAIVIGFVALMAALPVMLGTGLLVLSFMAFIFMSLGIVMVSLMILLTVLCIFITLFGIGSYMNYLKTMQQRLHRRSD